MCATAVLVGAMLTAVAAAPVPAAPAVAAAVSPAATAGSARAATAAALPTLWAGTLSFSDASLQTKDVPLNVTVGQTTASFTWYFTKQGGPPHAEASCRGQLEPSLKWEVNTSSGLVTARGTGANPDFYSFQGQLDGATNTINGTVYHPPFDPPSKMQACGSFTIRPVSAANPLKPPQCKASPPHPGPPSPHPGPAPPPHPAGNAHTNPAVWPAPAGFTQAGAAGSQAIVDAAALKLTCDGGSAEATAACGSAIAPAFARGKAWAFMVPDAVSSLTTSLIK